MEREITEVYCGNGKGKTTLAVGLGLRFATQGKSVIIIQFLKGRERRELDFLEELDNFDFKIFRFEKMDTCYNDLSEQEKAEERTNILNGLNFARKVIATRECDFLPSHPEKSSFLILLHALLLFLQFHPVSCRPPLLLCCFYKLFHLLICLAAVNELFCLFNSLFHRQIFRAKINTDTGIHKNNVTFCAF